MIDINLAIQTGAAADYHLILAKYANTDRLAYILRAQLGGSTMEVQDSHGQLLAHVTELTHGPRKSDWKVEFESEKRPDVLFKPNGFLSSKWKVESDDKVWDVGSGSEHKIKFGPTHIGTVTTARGKKGAQRVSVDDEQDVSTVICLAGAFYLKDLYETVTHVKLASVYY